MRRADLVFGLDVMEEPLSEMGQGSPASWLVQGIPAVYTMRGHLFRI